MATSSWKQAEERVKRGFPALWQQMQLGPPLSSGLPVRCPICYPIPGRTLGLAPYRCPYANPLILVDTPETRNFYPCPTASQAPPVRVPQVSAQPSSSVSAEGQKKRSLPNSSPSEEEIFTDCMLCQTIYPLPPNVLSDDPAAHTCQTCLQLLEDAKKDTSSSESSSSSSRKKPRTT